MVGGPFGKRTPVDSERRRRVWFAKWQVRPVTVEAVDVVNGACREVAQTSNVGGGAPRVHHTTYDMVLPIVPNTSTFEISTESSLIG